ncbi:hypothetical protein PALS2_194 [Staphylococcus phage PALS_2]|nr:hypothetical protein PALS2_194 [Staphylococcus phage PALS_2]UAJ16947.1 hypothetical protein UFVDC4_00019 [Staphylococcus phage vB_SauM-UFV_DC4]BDE75589.1 hypothetical protein [Staphylococcus phage S6]
MKNNITPLEEQIMQATDEALLREQNIMRLDERTKRKRRLNQLALVAAKEAQDPIYFKYQKAARARKKWRDIIRQKYATKAKLKLAELDSMK